MRAIIVHGWMAYPEFAWLPWLKKELESRGFETETLLLPNAEFPDRMTWSHAIRRAITSPETILIGHSLGCSAIMFALEEYSGDPVSQVICVEGFGRPFLMPLRMWFGSSDLNIERIKPKARVWTFIHSENDPLVPFAEGEWLARRFGAEVVRIKKGHVTQEEGYTELPEVIEAIGSV